MSCLVDSWVISQSKEKVEFRIRIMRGGDEAALKNSTTKRSFFFLFSFRLRSPYTDFLSNRKPRHPTNSWTWCVYIIIAICYMNSNVVFAGWFVSRVLWTGWSSRTSLSGQQRTILFFCLFSCGDVLAPLLMGAAFVSRVNVGLISISRRTSHAHLQVWQARVSFNWLLRDCTWTVVKNTRARR